MRVRLRLALVVSMALTVAPAAFAQAAGRPVGDHVLVAVSQHALPTGVRALVIRTAAGAQPDLIVLAPDASALHTLTAAAALLRSDRRAEPSVSRTVVHHVAFSEAHGGNVALKTRMEAALRKARHGELRVIEGIGTVHVASISLGLLR